MRDIKFRAWNGKAMEYGGFSVHATNGLILPCSGLTKVTDGNPLMQYTGLKDKNGVEIYEGDILKVTNDEEENIQIGKVWWFNCYYPAFDIYVPSETAKTGFESYNDEFNSFTLDYIEYEVIGNIYENEDLLR